jgi:hypothetical protein
VRRCEFTDLSRRFASRVDGRPGIEEFDESIETGPSRLAGH